MRLQAGLDTAIVVKIFQIECVGFRSFRNLRRKLYLHFGAALIESDPRKLSALLLSYLRIDNVPDRKS